VVLASAGTLGVDIEAVSSIQNGVDVSLSDISVVGNVVGAFFVITWNQCTVFFHCFVRLTRESHDARPHHVLPSFVAGTGLSVKGGRWAVKENAIRPARWASSSVAVTHVTVANNTLPSECLSPACVHGVTLDRVPSLCCAWWQTSVGLGLSSGS
jgi:hypothetical protein